jgi:hypothetical protein
MENRSTRRKPAPVLLGTPHIQHDLTCDRARTAGDKPPELSNGQVTSKAAFCRPTYVSVDFTNEYKGPRFRLVL